MATTALKPVTIAMDSSIETYSALNTRGKTRFCELYAKSLRASGYDADVKWNERINQTEIDGAPARFHDDKALESALEKAFTYACNHISKSYLK